MFGQLYYCDREKIDEYYSLLQGKKNFKINKVIMSGEKTGGVDLQILQGNKKSIVSYEGTIIENDMLALNDLISELEQTDDYLDFVDKEFDENHMVRNIIVRFETNFEVPVEFDNIRLLAESKEYGQEKIEEGINPTDIKLFRQYFSMKNPSIPIKFFINSKAGSAKLNPSNICNNIGEIEEYEGEDVVILARIISPSRNKSREIFDPLKDFFTISRSLRKNKDIFSGSIPEELSKIFMEDDYIELEILAIYQ